MVLALVVFSLLGDSVYVEEFSIPEEGNES
jgi:hypothetical protein